MSTMSRIDETLQNVYATVYTIQGSKMDTKAKHWKCPKCSATYHSPIPLTAVLCVTCSRKVKARETWMKQDD